MIIGRVHARLRHLDNNARVPRLRRMTRLSNGRYDAFIIDAQQRDDAVALELTITSGTHRGDVINIVTSTFATRDALSCIGLPCTLHVEGDAIRVTK